MAEQAKAAELPLSANDSLEAAKEMSPIPVSAAPFGEGDSRAAYYDRGAARIRVNETLSEKAQLKGLIHEISFLDVQLAAQAKGARRLAREMEPAQAMYAAQAKAYALCHCLGLPAREYRFQGLNRWVLGEGEGHAKQGAEERAQSVLESARAALASLSSARLLVREAAREGAHALQGGQKSLADAVAAAKAKRLELYGKQPEKEMEKPAMDLGRAELPKRQ
jgi:hypothetical protein